MLNVRVRIAPSPTGVPHIGTTRTALFNFLFAKHNNGRFILRIEDTDRTRLVAESEEKIYEILEWLELIPDEKYKQSERKEMYQKYARVLQEKGLTYEDNGAIRFRIEKTGETSWTDAIGEKRIGFKNETQEDFVLLKSDGFPTYNFANVVDDHLMKISHVIRGDEFISSTPKHILLYEAFGWKHPIFAHLPVILGPDKTKLSKRHGAESVIEYRDKGYLKEALLNFMALLGWNPGGEKEIMTMDEMIQLFDLKDVNTASPMFDSKKLEWMNGMYIRQLSIAELKLKVKSQKSKGTVDDKILRLAQSRMKTLNDFEGLVAPWVLKPSWKLTSDEKGLANDLIATFSSLQEWNKDAILEVLKKTCTERSVSMKAVYKIFTGSEQGLPVADMLEILGKGKTLEKLQKTS